MYKVQWKVVSTVPVACPDYKPDPYTGEYPSSGCLVYHCKEETKEMSKEFLTMEEALNFMSQAPKRKGIKEMEVVVI